MIDTTATCPKCGYSQEERLDCRRCGVVFSKYYALYPKGTSAQDEVGEETLAIPASSLEEGASAEVPQLRQQVRELNRRLTDFEFERAERLRLQGEIKGLDQNLQESLKEMAECLAGLQQQRRDQPPPVTPAESEIPALRQEILEAFSTLKHELHGSIEPLMLRLEKLETRVQTLVKPSAVKPDDKASQKLQKIEKRFAELEGKLQADSVKDQATGVVQELDKVLKEMDGLRTSLQNVTIRYSEIGELKKNHLVLLNANESTQRDLAALKNDPSNGATKKIAALDKEVIALRAEVRQTLTQMEKADAVRRVIPSDLEEKLDALAALRSAEELKIQAAVAELESRLKDTLPALSVLPHEVQSLAANVRLLEQHQQPREDRIAQMEGEIAALRAEVRQIVLDMEAVREKLEVVSALPPVEPLPPLETDVHAIRENLEDIRRFMTSLVQKN